jgi:hypothetical protein
VRGLQSQIAAPWARLALPKQALPRSVELQALYRAGSGRAALSAIDDQLRPPNSVSLSRAWGRYGAKPMRHIPIRTRGTGKSLALRSFV